MKKRLLIVALLSGILLACLIFSMFYFNKNDKKDTPNEEKSNSQEQEETTPEKEEEEDMTSMTIKIGEKESKVILVDNETTRELFKKLPLTITMLELNGNEKFYNFDSKFPSEPTAVGKIEVGDIMLYGDNCLVLFYQTFDTSYSYTRIGKLEDVSILDNIGNESVTVTLNK